MDDRPMKAQSTFGYSPPTAEKRISLAELMQRHSTVIRKIPGQEIEMLADTLGCERACIYTVPGSNSSGSESQIQLLFSIVAFDKRTKPIATLSLMENYERVKNVKLVLVLLDTSQDILVEYLKSKETPIAAYADINHYIEAIRSAIEAVGDDMVWA